VHLAGLDEVRKPQLAPLRRLDLQLSDIHLTNIFRVWIPHQGKVISTRDVISDEETFCGKKDLSSNKELIAHMDELLARVSLL
jgi:hypothetical protein